MDKHKDSPKKGKVAPRKASRRAEPVRRHSSARRTDFAPADFAPVYGWREEGDPPEVIRQGTLEELGERQRAGVRTSGISVVARRDAAIEVYTKRATALLHRWLEESGSFQRPSPDPFGKTGRALSAGAGKIGNAPTMLVVADEPRRAGRAKTSAKPSVADPGTSSVAVPAELLRAAREKTGIGSDAELVAFALSLLTEPDPAAEFLREERGSLPSDFRLEF